MNSDIILKAEDLYFSYDDEQSHSLKKDKKSHLWVLTEAENLPFFYAVPVF